jgi:hypothetical protein
MSLRHRFSYQYRSQHVQEKDKCWSPPTSPIESVEGQEGEKKMQDYKTQMRKCHNVISRDGWAIRIFEKSRTEGVSQPRNVIQHNGSKSKPPTDRFWRVRRTETCAYLAQPKSHSALMYHFAVHSFCKPDWWVRVSVITGHTQTTTRVQNDKALVRWH